jgi:integrase
LTGRDNEFQVAHHVQSAHRRSADTDDNNLFVVRQFDELPRPLSPVQLRELLATLPVPYDIMARWQLYTGLRVSEVLRVAVSDIAGTGAADASFRLIDVCRKGRKPGYVIAPVSLLEETTGYVERDRRAWIARRARRIRGEVPTELFIGSRGSVVSKNRYQQVVRAAGDALGFRATTHVLRATFACMMLARLERLAKQGAAINPLLIVKILMGHEHLQTTDRYLRAVAVDVCVLGEVIDSLLAEHA